MNVMQSCIVILKFDLPKYRIIIHVGKISIIVFFKIKFKLGVYNINA